MKCLIDDRMFISGGSRKHCGYCKRLVKGLPFMWIACNHLGSEYQREGRCWAATPRRIIIGERQKFNPRNRYLGRL